MDDDLDDRDVEIREEIDAHVEGPEDAEEAHQQDHDDDNRWPCDEPVEEIMHHGKTQSSNLKSSAKSAQKSS